MKKFVASEGGYILMNHNTQINNSPKKYDEFMERQGETPFIVSKHGNILIVEDVKSYPTSPP